MKTAHAYLLCTTLLVFTGSQLSLAAPAVPVVDRASGSSSITAAPQRQSATKSSSGPLVPANGSSGSGPLVPNRQSMAGIPANAGYQETEMLMLLEQLQEEVRYLRGRVEEQDHAMKQMQTDQRDRYRDLDRRITNLTRQLSSSSGTPTPLAPSSSSPSRLSTDSSAALSSSSTTGSVDDSAGNNVADSRAYQEAFELVRKRQYSQALEAFSAFRERYPDSPLLPNTLYWSGEVYRAKANPDYTQAKDVYLQLVERFPDHQKAPDANYKLGLTYQALGDSVRAKEVMNRVAERYAGKVPAQLAQDFLESQGS